MSNNDMSMTEMQRRRELIKYARNLLTEEMPIEAQDESSVMFSYRGFYLQVSFSELHPLMVFCLAKGLNKPLKQTKFQAINDLNLKSVLGSHAVNNEIGCYSYRATHWLDVQLDVKRIREILDRCVDEAQRGYQKVAV